MNKTQFLQYMYSYPHKTAYQKIEHLDNIIQTSPLKNKNIGLYVHVPFCDSKCGYCNLFSIPSQNTNVMQDYIDAIEKQNQQYQKTFGLENIKAESFILGGGTPTSLSNSQLEKLFVLAENYYSFDYEKDFSVIETSPNQTTDEKIKYLKSKNIKRISIGVQSFVQSELDTLDRNHNIKMVKNSLEILKLANFPILNIDLIYGIPNQSIESLIFSIDKILQYSPDEIFAYPLYAQANTRIGNKYKVDEQKQVIFYRTIKSYLEKNGYHQLSMRRFVKQLPKIQSSCGFENMIALGCGGRSYIDNLHFCEPYTAEPQKIKDNLKTFIKKTDFFADMSYYELNNSEQKRRYIIKNLLHISGIDIEDYNKYFEGDIFEHFPILLEFKKQGWIEINPKKICLTEKGMEWSDYIGPKFISKEVEDRMRKYDTIND